jgi:hypothetical protein
MLTEIQFNDFEIGIMGHFNCFNCKSPLLPTHRNDKIKVKSFRVKGKDLGWS